MEEGVWLRILWQHRFSPLSCDVIVILISEWSSPQIFLMPSSLTGLKRNIVMIREHFKSIQSTIELTFHLLWSGAVDLGNKTKPCLIFLKPTWIVDCALLEEMDGIMWPRLRARERKIKICENIVRLRCSAICTAWLILQNPEALT